MVSRNGDICAQPDRLSQALSFFFLPEQLVPQVLGMVFRTQDA